MYLCKVTREMNDLDARFDFNLLMMGSVEEQTKVGLWDEFDCRLHLGRLEGKDENIIRVAKERAEDVLLQAEPSLEKTTKDIVDQDGYISAAKLHHQVYKVLCKAVSMRSVLKGLPLYFKYMKDEQIHLEWVGEPTNRMAIKIDASFAVTLKNWWPAKGITDSMLISEEDIRRETCIRLCPDGWRPSACLQERLVMKNMPIAAKWAFMFCKVVLNTMCYTKEEEPFRVKSYYLKNALFYAMDKIHENEGLTIANTNL